MRHETTEALVVGGSLVGLSSALFLAARGVRVTLVEPHLGSHPHPRAIGYTARTLELLRSVGLAEKIPETPKSFRLQRASVESLSGAWKEATDWTPSDVEAPSEELSPHQGAAIAQDLVEPLLRARARELGADLRLGSALVRFEQDEEGVVARIAEKAGGEYELRAPYMIAADGSKSPVREALGIRRRGPGPLQTVRSVLFHAHLDEFLTTDVRQFEIDQPGLRAFLTTYGDNRWVLMFLDEEERSEAQQREAIERAIGRSGVPVELITTGRWELSALVAERFSEGRVFLAGDAAHTLPPTRGGYGANTGIADAHNLAWKLAAVLSGASTPELLATYDAERNPVAWTRLEQTFARPDYAKYGQGFEHVRLFDDAAMELGQLYRSAGILDAGDELPAAARPDVWAGQPGTRAPHLWVTKAGRRISTLDLLGRDWVLITTEPRWSAPNEVVVERDFDAADAEAVRAAFGLGRRGASLVRPDGVIAWRAKDLPEDPEGELRAAYAKASFAAR